MVTSSIDLEDLRSQGFVHPEEWVDFAAKNGFRRVSSTLINSCPDCGNGRIKVLGQYVFYSTLIKLCECRNCSLIFADRHLDPSVVSAHFESCYKDENYFQNSRSLIFDQIADLVEDEVSRRRLANPRILDIGGAKGHLSKKIKDRLPSPEILLNDLSVDACREAAERFGLKTHCGAIAKICDLSLGSFDIILLVDVLYYDPAIQGVWDSLLALSNEKTTLIFRLPNRLLLIKLCLMMQRLWSSERKRCLQNHVQFYNPEHIYIFSQRYLSSRLRSIGFNRIEFLPARGLKSCSFVEPILYSCSKLAGNLLLPTSSQIVVARK